MFTTRGAVELRADEAAVSEAENERGSRTRRSTLGFRALVVTLWLSSATRTTSKHLEQQNIVGVKAETQSERSGAREGSRREHATFVRRGRRRSIPTRK